MRFKIILLSIFFAVLIWSGIAPKDSFTWVLEVAPAVIGLLVLFFTRKTFPLTPMLYILILIHSIILMIGGHYTYAEVPFFDTVADWFGSSRNNYDKVGHLAQGFIPAMIAREILIRKKVVNGTNWLNVIIVCMAMAISVTYEFIEWFGSRYDRRRCRSFFRNTGLCLGHTV